VGNLQLVHNSIKKILRLSFDTLFLNSYQQRIVLQHLFHEITVQNPDKKFCL